LRLRVSVNQNRTNLHAVSPLVGWKACCCERGKQEEALAYRTGETSISIFSIIACQLAQTPRQHAKSDPPHYRQQQKWREWRSAEHSNCDWPDASATSEAAAATQNHKHPACRGCCRDGQRWEQIARVRVLLTGQLPAVLLKTLCNCRESASFRPLKFASLPYYPLAASDTFVLLSVSS
jgi:hypothetical protein